MCLRFLEDADSGGIDIEIWEILEFGFLQVRLSPTATAL